MSADDMNRVRVWASWETGYPRLVAEMSREDWLAGKEIPRVPPLAWGEAWTDAADPVAGILLRIMDGDIIAFNALDHSFMGRLSGRGPLGQIIQRGPGPQVRVLGTGGEYLVRWEPGEFSSTATISLVRPR